MRIENQSLADHVDDDGHVRLRFYAKDAKVYRYTIRSNAPALDGREGELTTFHPAVDVAPSPDPSRPNWWTDDPSPAVAESSPLGAKTVSQWREYFLCDFAVRLDHCRALNPSPSSSSQ